MQRFDHSRLVGNCTCGSLSVRLLAVPSLAPSVEGTLLQNTQAVETEEVAQTLLQVQSISIEQAMAMQLPLCVPVEIGQLNRCVAVTYGASPQPSAYDAHPGEYGVPGMPVGRTLL